MKRNPGKYNYGSSGNYGTMHVPMEMKAAADPTGRQVIAKAGSPVEYLDAPEFQT